MALTQTQLAHHIGHMLIRGLINWPPGEIYEGITPQLFVAWCKDYRENGGQGTLADRKEAMSIFLKRYFIAITGRNFDTIHDAAHGHAFLEHWVEACVPGEAAHMVDGVVV